MAVVAVVAEGKLSVAAEEAVVAVVAEGKLAVAAGDSGAVG